MRGLVRAFLFLLAFFPVLILAQSAVSQERRLVVTEGADYFGADYDIRRDVDLETCQAACRDDDQCRAFTYNASARWCFLKSEVGELRAVEGAVSGRIVASEEPAVDVVELHDTERTASLFILYANCRQ